MMIGFKKIYIVVLLGFLSCKYSDKTNLKSDDTTAIFKSILNSKIFVKENLCTVSDSLFLLKTKYYNESWPLKSDYFKIFYIEDIPQSKILNFGPNFPYDGRTRISVLKFNQKKDTISVLMYNQGPNVFFNFDLVKKNASWTIVKEDFTSGGRKSYYGFEKDKWYLDLKSKIKATDEYNSFRPNKLK